MLQPAQASAAPPPRPSFAPPAAAAPNNAAAQLLLYQQQIQQQQLNALLRGANDMGYATGGLAGYGGAGYVAAAPLSPLQGMPGVQPAGGALLSGSGLPYGGGQGAAALGRAQLGSLTAADIQALRMQLAAASLQQQQAPPTDGQQQGVLYACFIVLVSSAWCCFGVSCRSIRMAMIAGGCRGSCVFVRVLHLQYSLPCVWPCVTPCSV